MSALVVKIPAKHRALGGAPNKPLQIVSLWEMTEGRIGVWVGEPGQATGTRWPVTDVTREQVLSWQVKP